MLHTIFNLTRPLFVLDTETTGLTEDARIIELGFQQWTSDGMIKEWRSLIDPGIPVPPEITELTGITDEQIQACQSCKLPRDQHTCGTLKIAPRFEQLAPNLAKGMSNCDYAGKNIRFDLKKLFSSFKRSRVPWDYANARIVDIDRLEALAIPRNLSAMHEQATGAPHDGAHGALSDVRASVTVLLWQFSNSGKPVTITRADLPTDLDTIHALSWPGWIVADGSFRFLNNKPTVSFGKYNGKTMQEVQPSYWDFILTNDFPADVKQLASDAKLGKFPSVTPEEGKAADKRMEQAG